MELQTASRSTLTWTGVICTSTIQIASYPHAGRAFAGNREKTGAQKGNRKLGDRTEEVLNYREVKKLGMKNRKGCVMGAHGLGILGQRYDEGIFKIKTKKFSLSKDQIHPAKKMFHLAHMVVFQLCFK